MRPTYALINLSNLKYNYLQIKKKVKNSKMMAVVKADAYGHGMIKCVEALQSLKNKRPDYYAVALFEEGKELRKSKIVDQPILTFSPFNSDELKEYFRFDLMPTITNADQIKQLSSFKLSKKLKVHVNIETGMGRLGISYKEAVEQIIRLSKIKNVVIDGIYTHFATSDEKDKTYANQQLNRFKKVIEELKFQKIEIGKIHCANSGAIIDMPESYFDMVRPGISLYGYYPSLETSESIKLKPVMSIISEVENIRKIKKGESVSYGRRYIAKNETNIFTVPIGYADGIPRNLTNKIECIISDKKFKQIGTITMDRIMFESGSKLLKTGTNIQLLGKSKSYEINAWDWSKLINTIPYEITCGISKRVPRKYK
ncbi:MAG: alanine racemase [Melioribacteraceae bacterium]|nr:alanine racemase [Melioribacteraceae bacterium]